jgi:hypothetical protein
MLQGPPHSTGRRRRRVAGEFERIEIWGRVSREIGADSEQPRCSSSSRRRRRPLPGSLAAQRRSDGRERLAPCVLGMRLPRAPCAAPIATGLWQTCATCRRRWSKPPWLAPLLCLREAEVNLVTQLPTYETQNVTTKNLGRLYRVETLLFVFWVLGSWVNPNKPASLGVRLNFGNKSLCLPCDCFSCCMPETLLISFLGLLPIYSVEKFLQVLGGETVLSHLNV